MLRYEKAQEIIRELTIADMEQLIEMMLTAIKKRKEMY